MKSTNIGIKPLLVDYSELGEKKPQNPKLGTYWKRGIEHLFEDGAETTTIEHGMIYGGNGNWYNRRVETYLPTGDCDIAISGYDAKDEYLCKRTISELENGSTKMYRTKDKDFLKYNDYYDIAQKSNDCRWRANNTNQKWEILNYTNPENRSSLKFSETNMEFLRVKSVSEIKNPYVRKRARQFLRQALGETEPNLMSELNTALKNCSPSTKQKAVRYLKNLISWVIKLR